MNRPSYRRSLTILTLAIALPFLVPATAAGAEDTPPPEVDAIAELGAEDDLGDRIHRVC